MGGDGPGGAGDGCGGVGKGVGSGGKGSCGNGSVGGGSGRWSGGAGTGEFGSGKGDFIFIMFTPNGLIYLLHFAFRESNGQSVSLLQNVAQPPLVLLMYLHEF